MFGLHYYYVHSLIHNMNTCSFKIDGNTLYLPKFVTTWVSSFFAFFEKRFFRKIVPEINPTDLFVETRQKKLLDSYSVCNSNYFFSGNIHSCFYSKKDLDSELSHSDNSLEKEWKTRILIDNTPRGNIIMFYDVYKNGFSYYSDDNNVPYRILNAVAMKYVLMFCCRDFFVDETCVPVDHLSPLIKVFFKNEKENESNSTYDRPAKKDQGLVTTAEKNIDVKNGPFAKFKNYRLQENQQPVFIKQNTSFLHTVVRAARVCRFLFMRSCFYLYRKFFAPAPSKISQAPQLNNKNDIKQFKDKYTNKFIKLGKLYNFHPLQKQSLMVPDKNATQFDYFFSPVHQRETLKENTVLPSKLVTGLVQTTGSAVNRATNSHMSWQDYKQKFLDEA